MYEAVEEFSTVIELLPEVLKNIIEFSAIDFINKKVAFPLWEDVNLPGLISSILLLNNLCSSLYLYSVAEGVKYKEKNPTVNENKIITLEINFPNWIGEIPDETITAISLLLYNLPNVRMIPKKHL